MNTIGKNISRYRKEKGLTQEELAELCRVSPQAVSKWENNISCPDIMQLKPLAHIFGISVDQLLDDGSTPIVFFAQNEKVKGTLLKIRCVDNSDKININLPIALIELLLKSGNISNAIKWKDNSNPFKDVDFEKVLEMASLGVLGKILEMESKNGEIAEIWIE